MSWRHRGTVFEYEARDKILEFIIANYHPVDVYVTRSAGSHTEADLVFVFKNPLNENKTEVWLVQCSKRKKTKSELSSLVFRCKNVGAIPVLAYKKDKTFILEILDYDGNVSNRHEL